MSSLSHAVGSTSNERLHVCKQHRNTTAKDPMELNVPRQEERERKKKAPADQRTASADTSREVIAQKDATPSTILTHTLLPDVRVKRQPQNGMLRRGRGRDQRRIEYALFGKMSVQPRLSSASQRTFMSPTLAA